MNPLLPKGEPITDSTGVIHVQERVKNIVQQLWERSELNGRGTVLQHQGQVRRGRRWYSHQRRSFSAPCGKTIAKQVVSLQPTKQMDVSWRKLQPMQSPHSPGRRWNSCRGTHTGPVTHGGHTLEHSAPEVLYPIERTHDEAVPEVLQVMRETHTGALSEGLYPVGGSHAGAGNSVRRERR